MDQPTPFEKDSLIITPNQRLSAFLHLRTPEQQLTWQTENIIPITTWIKTLWKHLIEKQPGYLLSTTEELLIFQQIISRNDAGLLNPNSSAKTAYSAYQTLMEWGLSSTDKSLLYTDNALMLAQWVSEFEKTCEKNNWVTQAKLVNMIIDEMDFIAPRIPQKITFYHFLEYTPMQQTLINKMKAQGINVDIQNPHAEPGVTSKVCFNNKEEEINAMVHWAKQYHNEHSEHYIACVTPDLNADKTCILRAFQQAFNQQSPPIDFSQGNMFSSYPIIEIIFNILSLNTKRFPFEQFSKVIRSPFIGDSIDSLCSRHQLDKILRKFVSPTTSKMNLRSLLGNDFISSQVDTKHLTHCLDSLTNPTKAPPSIQAQRVLDQLIQFGWPGSRVLDSTEHQLCKRFIQLLDESKKLNKIHGAISFHDFIKIMRQQSNELIFQPESEKTHIQVLGVLEASGLEFDAMWVIGLSDLAWPTKPKQNPFIPVELQRQHNMPHCHANRELEYCQAITQGFINNTDKVIFSYPKTTLDLTLRPSPLIEDVAIDQSLASQSPRKQHEKNDEHLSLESIEDYNGPAITSNEAISGGTDIFRRQALCPFQSFAHTRLHADSISMPTQGFSLLEQGTLTHRVLQFFWEHVKTQSALNALSPKNLELNIEKSVDKTLGQQHYTLEKSLIKIEKQRLCALIKDWLEIEKLRDNFSVIALEAKRYHQFQNITIKMQVDRIDLLADGSHAIIDYKTGSPSISSWFSSRPKEPQLPAYCISNESTVGALLYAQVQVNNMFYKGLSVGAMSPNTITPIEEQTYSTNTTFPEQITQWNSTLEQLAEQFITGVAKVDPVDANACQYCQLNTLCRINEYAD